MQWQTIYKKEMLDHWRHFKWIWVPIVFILFAVMDPLTAYFMPIILESAGNVPEGATIDIPNPSVGEAMIMSFSQLNMLGVLIAVVISMGLISRELSTGVYELILSKPVRYSHYITAKFTAMMTLLSVSIIIALITGWYYVTVLFGDLAFTQLLTSAIFYIFYFMLILSIVMVFNSFLTSPGLVAFLSIFTVVVLNAITSIFDHVITWSPMLISDYIGTYFFSGEIETDLYFSTGIAIIISLLLLWLSIFLLKRQEMH
ncbi:ABC transporter permease [Alkalibacillus salilacus]|uniref:ABC-2 type transport system permease protein n=1 Tax=Alkalibacillus salilacus TaxID=284582 RepID=A0ABT9VFR6_9BACI|nr:ABC transporter permease subunit [Alkalibacillus salilacus]MDQ0159820.1 ABC-2 type transport system permease protein [Alkalibacillus salilacus]